MENGVGAPAEVYHLIPSALAPGVMDMVPLQSTVMIPEIGVAGKFTVMGTDTRLDSQLVVVFTVEIQYVVELAGAGHVSDVVIGLTSF
ncbi:MAG TPA: hypothetical protein PLX35_14495 [Cyclobacteriaceae bacterium]|nr:hypothetical protein [Cyclobacteriaceae bacterium]